PSPGPATTLRQRVSRRRRDVARAWTSWRCCVELEDLAGSPKAAARAAFLGVRWCYVDVRVRGDDEGVVNGKGRDKSGYSPL
ncbi:hypothetical protein ACOTFB_15255, partial [Achromobacter xylosoxidans]